MLCKRKNSELKFTFKHNKNSKKCYALKIYFAPCGIGLGHAGRCIEIAKKLKNCDILFSTYSDAADFVKKEGFKLALTLPFSYWNWPDGTPDSWRTIRMLSGRIIGTVLKQIKREVEQITVFDPDLIVSDSRLSTVIAGKITNKPIMTILNQTFIVGSGCVHHKFYLTLSNMFSHGFIGSVWNLSEKIIVPDFPMPYSISKNNLRAPPSLMKKMEFVGPILPVKPETLPEKESLKYQLGFDGRPLIYVPVSGPKWERWWLGRKMVELFSNFSEDYQVVISLGDSNNANLCNKKGNVAVYTWISNRFELLKACDLVIGRGGHTTVTQTLAYGKPMILIPTQEQTEQVYNAKTASEIGVAKMLDQRYLSKKLITATIEEIFSNHRYTEKAEKIMGFASKLDAINTIIKLISSTVNN